MAAQVVAILLLILGPKHMQEFFVLGHAALWVATIAALVSAVDYSRRANAALGSRSASPAPEPVPLPTAPPFWRAEADSPADPAADPAVFPRPASRELGQS
jgi:hypothetical protein